MSTVRRATSADLPALAALERACFPSPWRPEALEGELGFEDALLLVLEAPEGKVTAYAAFRLLPREAELLRLAVDPSKRRQGLASRLLASGLEAVRERGAESCFLEVRADNAPAIAVYQHHGFREIGLRRAYYEDGADALVLARSA